MVLAAEALQATVSDNGNDCTSSPNYKSNIETIVRNAATAHSDMMTRVVRLQGKVL